MKSNQIPLKSSNRRSKETPTKTKIVAKSLNLAFSAASERNSIDSLLQSVISDGSPEKNIIEEVSNPSLLESSDEIDLLDFSPATEIEHGSRDISELSRISSGSSGSRTESVEVQVAVDLLLQAREQVVNSVDVDRRSKKIVDDLIKSVIEPLDLVAMERERFYCRLREKTKHIEVDYHYIRDKVVRKEITVRYVSSNDQVGDIFTKGLSSPRFQKFKDKLMARKWPITLRECIDKVVNK